MAIAVIPASDVRSRAGTRVPGFSPAARVPNAARALRPAGVFAVGAALALFVLPVLEAAAQATRQRPAEETPEQYPPGQHRDDTFYFCTGCHGFKIVAQQGMSRERWNETFDFMVKRHNMLDVQGELREQMLDYLAQAFPERRAPGGWRNPFEGK